jgi:hypothetical protein
MRIWRLLVATSLLGAGAVAVACSSSSSGGGGGTPEAGTDSGDDGAMGADAPACVPNAMKVSTLDGGASWGCIETACKTELTACAADCDCNNAVLGALSCIQTMGVAATMTCFTTALTPVVTNAAVTPLITCLQGHSAGCGGPVVDGGGDAHSDAPASDAPASDAPASDAPASDAPASDAPADSAADSAG